MKVSLVPHGPIGLNVPYTHFLTHPTVLQANPSVLLYTPIEDLLRDKDGKPHEPTAEEKEAQKEEVKAVAAASAGKHDEALDMLNAVISKYPEYASAYNNRYKWWFSMMLYNHTF